MYFTLCIHYILWYNECIVNILIKNKKILRNNIYLKNRTYVFIIQIDRIVYIFQTIQKISKIQKISTIGSPDENLRGCSPDKYR